jgi:hypothetical protein
MSFYPLPIKELPSDKNVQGSRRNHLTKGAISFSLYLFLSSYWNPFQQISKACFILFLINWYPLPILYTEAIIISENQSIVIRSRLVYYSLKRPEFFFQICKWKSIEQHLKKKLHIDNLKIKRTN